MRRHFPATFEPRLMSATEGWFYTGATSAGSIGDSYTGIGDVNADGYDDLFVGTGNWAEEQAHYLLYGGADRDTLILDPASIDPADGIYIGEMVVARPIGDFNGDDPTTRHFTVVIRANVTRTPR